MRWFIILCLKKNMCDNPQYVEQLDIFEVVARKNV